jgi:hypothetical protein
MACASWRILSSCVRSASRRSASYLAEAEGDDLIPADQVFDELRHRYRKAAVGDAGSFSE